MRFWEHVSFYSPPLLLILHTCGVRSSHGSNFKSRRFFPSSAPVFQRQCFSATWILWVFRPFSFEHYTNHWALGCPRPPTRSMQIFNQKLPSPYGWEAKCIWKYQCFSREAETVPWTGIWRQQMWLFGGQFWKGGWIWFGFSCCFFKANWKKVKMFSLSPDWECPSLIF